MNIVIIEDEKLTAKDLAKTIKSIDDEADSITCLHSVEESLEYFSESRNVQLIFADIQLGDGLSFTIFDRLHLEIPVIFCTAYDEYSLQAFKTYGIDYILKPFSKVTVERTLTKYRTLQKNLSTQSNSGTLSIQALRDQLIEKDPSIMVYQGDKIIPIRGSSIALFHIHNGNIYALTFAGKQYLIKENLDELEKQFSPNFFRANRHILLSRRTVNDVTTSFNRKLKVNINVPFNEDIIVGKLKNTAFLDWLSNF